MRGNLWRTEPNRPGRTMFGRGPACIFHPMNQPTENIFGKASMLVRIGYVRQAPHHAALRRRHRPCRRPRMLRPRTQPQHLAALCPACQGVGYWRLAARCPACAAVCWYEQRRPLLPYQARSADCSQQLGNRVDCCQQTGRALGRLRAAGWLEWQLRPALGSAASGAVPHPLPATAAAMSQMNPR